MNNATDYRNTKQCLSLVEVATKKNALKLKIQGAHKRTKIIYNRINDRGSVFFKEFACIYNFKCAYCGTSINITDGRLFEIDHYICESAFSNDTAGRIEAGKIENLIFSCYSCNRGKRNLHIKDNHLPLLNPDDNSISNVFLRNSDYYIKIQEKYLEDKFIQLFYAKLMLGSEFRRLDFLLLEMDKLIIQLQTSNKDLAGKLEQCKGKLIQKRNCIFI